MRRFATTLAVLVVMGSVPQTAQGQILRGRVLEVGGERPLAGALVQLHGGDGKLLKSATAGETGLFMFDRLRPGTYRLNVHAVGYTDFTSWPLSVKVGDDLTVDVNLDVDAIALEPLVVTASRRPWYEHTKPPGLWEFYERKDHSERLGIGSFITESEIREWDAFDPESLVAAIVPGFWARNVRGRRYQLIGRNGCTPLIYLDGRLVRALGGVAEFGPSSTLAAVEVYRGLAEVPGELFRPPIASGGPSASNPSATCGAVAFWSARTVRGGN